VLLLLLLLLLQVCSYGVGGHVKLPGAGPGMANSYDFGIHTYKYIYEDLKAKVRRISEVYVQGICNSSGQDHAAQ
jgi:hypothetical protein